MEQIVRRRRQKRKSQQGLFTLIGVLVALLAVVVIIALSLRSGGNTDPTDSHSPSGSVAPSDTAPIVIRDLVLTAPERTELLCLEDHIVFSGTADHRETLTIGETAVAVAEDGSFSHNVELSQGMNEITVTYKGETVTYRIEHRYALQSYAPDTDTTYGCGAAVQLSASIRQGASLTVTLNGKTVAMEESTEQMGTGVAEGFVLYTGTYKLPNTNTEDLNLGPIEFVVSCDGITETYRSGDVICQKSGDVLASDPSVTPDYGDYMDVGSGYIVEIVANSAETFLGSGSGDRSNPRLNYLPMGTVDYGSAADIQAKASLVHLRCGRQVYLKQIKNYPPAGNKSTVVDYYKGTLPDHNELAVAQLQQDKNYTVLVLDTMWKAPFLLDILPQSYSSESQFEFAINSFTVEYVEITFCYATVFQGQISIPSDNPLFSHAELTQNESDCTLRLYLKEAGGFYGWDAYYNEQDQLCFRFINPKKVSKTSANSYGVDLTGVRILIDVGHGGIDGGAQPTGCDQDEAALNLQLALKLQAELESMGATVIMNRTTDASISVQERIGFLKEQAPDLCIAIHQNSNTVTSVNGGWVCYYTPFSMNAAQLIYNETEKTDVYQKVLLTWDRTKYFVGRETTCPVILMENGFMSHAGDYSTMTDENAQLQKAQAMARGIAAYFLDISI